jgi:acetyltransferase-like isoleucine patch superfamily enzyme
MNSIVPKQRYLKNIGPYKFESEMHIQYVPGLSLQEEKNIFLILRKNFRGITFFASSETPISVIRISVLIHCILKLTFFVKIWFRINFYVINFITIGLVF